MLAGVLSPVALFSQDPNIVFILADDLGYGDLACYGAPDIKTPAIDKLYEEGISFTRAYANCTVSSPSRAAILTGEYPDMVGVPGVVRDMPHNTWGNLSDHAPMLPEKLLDEGYNTALIGKWHLGYEAPDIPTSSGFSYFKGFLGDMMDDYYTHLRDGVNWMRENSKTINPEGHATDLFTRWAMDYIKEQSKEKEPFFLFLAYNAPHNPVQPPDEWLNRVVEREPQASPKRQKLIAFIEHLDHGVGKVVSTIEELDLEENTIVVFTSDNGGALNHGARNKPFRGGKGDMFEGGIRIPCIVKWPRTIQPSVNHHPIILMDFFPTMLDIAGGEIDSALPSKSILPLMKGEKLSEETRTMVFVRREGHRYGGQDYYAISDGEYKLLQNNPYEPYELYHISRDSTERRPAENNKVYEELYRKITKHIQETGEVPWQ